MIHSESNQTDATICPKRLWVMNTLSDEDTLVGESGLPQTLRLHLSRCDACNELAKRLMAVSASLASLGELEPETTLADRAHHRVLTALADGARLTGRVEIPDEPVELNPGFGAMPWRRYAVAASVALALGASGFLAFQAAQDGPIQRSRVNQWTGITEEPAPQPPVQPQLREADGRSDEPVAAAEITVTDARDSEQPDDLPSPMNSDEPVLTEDAVADSFSPQGVGNTRTVRSARKRRSWVCEHDTVEEAALCNNPHGVHQAVVLPRRVRRNLARHPRRVDNPPRARSTTPGRGGR